MKKITKKQAEELCFKVDMEGLAYALKEGYLDAPGTVLEEHVENAKKAIQVVDDIIEELREKYDLGYS